MHTFLAASNRQTVSRFLTLFLFSGSLWPASAMVNPAITSIDNLASFDTRLSPGEPAIIFGTNLEPNPSILVRVSPV